MKKSRKVTAAKRRERIREIENVGHAAEKAARDFIYRLHNTATKKAMASKPSVGLAKWRAESLVWDKVASFIEKHWADEDKRFAELVDGR